MLVLSRRVGEAFYLGDNIRVVVVRVEGGKVRLAIEAPRDVPIFRSELLPPDGPRRLVSGGPTS